MFAQQFTQSSLVCELDIKTTWIESKYTEPENWICSLKSVSTDYKLGEPEDQQSITTN